MSLIFCFLELSLPIHPASVAQLDARPTDYQEIGGSTPIESETRFRGH